MKYKILHTLYILTLSFLLSNCNKPKMNNNYIVSDVVNIALANDDPLKKWKKQIEEYGDYDAFYNLTIFYEDEINSNKKEELISYIKIMAEEYNNLDAYLLYYNYFTDSTLRMTDTVKAIEYLKMASMEKYSLVGELARLELANLYTLGKYSIKKDSSIANYLEKGGCNIDSISQIRRN